MNRNEVDVLGIISLALGILGILTCCCYIGIVFIIAGLVMGIVGIIVQKKSGNAFSIAGTILNAIAIGVIGFLFIYSFLPSNSDTETNTDRNSYEEVVEENILFDTSKYINMDYKSVENELIEFGFNNITFEEVPDLDISMENKAGKVETITIGDEKDFASNELNEKILNEIVVITYHVIPEYNTQILVDFESNWFLNKYDVDVYVDDNKIETLSHGQDLDTNIILKKGKHKVKFAKNNKSKVNGETEITINYDTEVKFIISCESDYVEVKKDYEYSMAPLEEGKSQIKRNKSDFIDKNYKDIEQIFKTEGFTNIICEPVYDIKWGITEKESVSNVYVNGYDDFKKGDIVDSNTEIKIIYHMPAEDDIGEMDSSYDDYYEDEYTKKYEFRDSLYDLEEEFMDKPFVESREILKERGYQLQYVHEDTDLDFTGELDSMSDEELNACEWIIRGVDKWDYDYSTKTITLIVNSAINIREKQEKIDAKNNLEEKFSSASALAALETYGGTQYKNGFKIHMIIGCLSEEVYDSDTWLLKYKAKYKDSSGNWVECICEGKVKGPESNPKVYDFLVY